MSNGTANETYSFLPTGIHGSHYILGDKSGFAFPNDEGLSILLHGAPGTGKTTVALQMMMAAWQEGYMVIYLSRDMSTTSLVTRVKEYAYFGANTEEKCKWLNLGELFGGKVHTASRNADDSISAFFNDVSSELAKLDKSVDTPRSTIRKIAGRFRAPNDAKQKKRNKRDDHILSLIEELFVPQTGNPDERYPILMGRLQLTGVSTGYYRERYSPVDSMMECLARICPDYSPLFNLLERANDDRKDEDEKADDTEKVNADKEKPPRVMVILDSFPRDFLEEYFAGLRDGFFLPRTVARGSRGIAHFLAVMESKSGPFESGAAFPPDVQIELALEHVAGREKPMPTIRFAKTRFQKARTERFPYIIQGPEPCKGSEADTDGGKSKGEAMRMVAWASQAGETTDKWSDWPPLFRTPGLSILPTMGALKRSLPTRMKAKTARPELMFGGKGLVDMTSEKSLVPGVTLLVTENGCFNTELGLYYLLNLNDGKWKGEDVSLYISLFSDIGGIAHRIRKHARSLTAINSPDDLIKLEGHRPDSGGKHSGHLPVLRPDSRGKHSGHLPVYRLPLKSGNLLVLPAGTASCEPEEILERFALMLDENVSTRTMRRVLLDRTSCIQKRWPLTQNVYAFVECLAAICRHWGTDLMILDDMAMRREQSNHFDSPLTGLANNIISLTKVPFQGHKEVAMELIRADGRSIADNRPFELRVEQTEAGVLEHHQLARVDSFRGYTGLYEGNPHPCSIRIDLTYDEAMTPLNRAMMRLRRDILALMPHADVQVMGPDGFSGVNGALSSLARTSCDGCHIVSIDDIWLGQLLQKDGLAQMEDKQAKEAMGEEPTDDRNLSQIAESIFITRALTIVADELNLHRKKKKDKPDIVPVQYAIPFRHNWGVLTVATVKAKYADVLKDSKTGESAGEKGTINIFGTEVLKGGKLCASWVDLLKLKLTWDERTKQQGEPGTNSVDISASLTIPQGMKREPIPCEFFDLAHSCRESVSSFLLELLLVRMGFECLFKKTDHTGAVKKNGRFFAFRSAVSDFNADDPLAGYVNRWCEALTLFYGLLSPLQRREIGVGVDAEDEPEWVQLGEAKRTKKKSRGRRHWALISREWVTTVPDILVDTDDPREGISMYPMPLWGKDNDPWKGSDFKECLKDVYDYCIDKNIGPTVAGSWYLGVLSGGDTELAIPLIREMVSEHHERERLFDRSGAPVRAALYRDYAADFESATHVLPYADVLEKIVKIMEKNENMEKCGHVLSMIPFARTRILNYTDISDVLYDLVRHVMRLPESDFEFEHLYRGEGAFKPQRALEHAVKTSLERIAQIPRRCGQTGGQ